MPITLSCYQIPNFLQDSSLSNQYLEDSRSMIIGSPEWQECMNETFTVSFYAESDDILNNQDFINVIETCIYWGSDFPVSIYIYAFEHPDVYNMIYNTVRDNIARLDLNTSKKYGLIKVRDMLTIDCNVLLSYKTFPMNFSATPFVEILRGIRKNRYLIENKNEAIRYMLKHPEKKGWNTLISELKKTKYVEFELAGDDTLNIIGSTDINLSIKFMNCDFDLLIYHLIKNSLSGVPSSFISDHEKLWGYKSGHLFLLESHVNNEYKLIHTAILFHIELTIFNIQNIMDYFSGKQFCEIYQDFDETYIDKEIEDVILGNFYMHDLILPAEYLNDFQI